MGRWPGPPTGDKSATMLTSEKVRCSPSSPCARAEARCAWLRATARLPSPPLAPWAGVARSERESSRAGRTGKLAWRSCRLDRGVPLGIEHDSLDRRPVSGCAAPAPWVGLACPLVKFVPGGEQGAILTGVTLRRHVANAAVPMNIVVPVDEVRRPTPRRIEFGEPSDREFRPVFGGAEQCFGIRIVVADARS